MPRVRFSRFASNSPAPRRRRTGAIAFLALATAGAGLASVEGCSPVGDGNDFVPSSSSDVATSTTTATGTGGASATSSGAGGDLISTVSAGGSGGSGGSIVNPCGSECGDVELCDDDHLGLDDNCNNQVDEGCPCNTGQAHACFKGDPSYHNAPGCYDGTMKCSENGQWGPCIGGLHVPDNCFANDVTNCHAITAVPFQDVDLQSGTGAFSIGAITETWSVTCPAGVSPCPAVGGANPSDDFKPLQSGQYDVTYTKTVSGGGSDSCTYPLFVGAPGLRIELGWEHDLGGTGVDLDLHVHQPNNTLPWSIYGEAQDCTWSNCVVGDFSPPQSFGSPDWFAAAGMPPTPLSWYLDPVFEKNTCYFAPRGVGQTWQNVGLGCHNPRLDLDNITCDPLVLDPDDSQFCAPENVNIDFPPDGQWIRIGVHYFSSHGKGYDVHPTIKVFCDGALAADLGGSGFYNPEQPVTFTPADGGGFSNRFWMVADVAFKQSVCDTTSCVVQPIYSDTANKTPFLTTDTGAESDFGPAVPPAP